MTYKLVLLRHGQSAWNKTNQFTGWVDVPLTEQGVEEAKNGGRLLKEKNVLPDIVFTSMLRRAINTANVALDEADRLWIPVATVPWCGYVPPSPASAPGIVHPPWQRSVPDA